MKFLTLEEGQLGALVDGAVVDIVAAAEFLSVTAPAATLEALIIAGDSKRCRKAVPAGLSTR